MISDEGGEIIEQPMSSEVIDRLVEPDDSVKLTPNVRKWQDRVAVARKIREKKLKDLDKYIDYYEGIQWHTDEDFVLHDKATVNLIFANIKKELPHLYFQNPTPIVNPRRNEFELSAFAMQELLKFYVKYNIGTELKKHVRLCILDAKFSFGCAKVSYTPRFSPNPDKYKPTVIGYDDMNIPIFLKNEQGDLIVGEEETITSELYYVERMSPREMLIDPECRNFPERASWIGHEVVKSLKYLKESKLYKNQDAMKRNVELSDLFQFERLQEVKDLSDDEDTQKVRFVEIYDLKNQKLLVLPDDTNAFIREEGLYMNPFSFLKFNEKPDEFYPVSDISQEKPLQQEVNIGRSLMITHARRSARKYVYDQNTFQGVDEVEGVEAMKNPDDLTMVKVADTDKPPAPLAMAAQDPSVFMNLNQSRIDYNEVTGGTEASRGMSERRKTGEEAGFQESHGAVRRGDKQSLVADFMVDTYAKLGKLMQETMTVAQAIKIIGSSGIFWTQVERGDIKGELLYDVNVSDMRPQIPEMDRQELSEFVFALSNFINALSANPVLMQVFDLKGIISEFAKSYPSLNVDKMLNVKVTPEQISEMIMMQLQQKQKGGDADI